MVCLDTKNISFVSFLKTQGYALIQIEIYVIKSRLQVIIHVASEIRWT